MVEILDWRLVATKNSDPTEANDESLSWKIINKIRFKSDDPSEWGEFRAYGGSWTRVLNRSYKLPDLMSDGPPQADPTLRNNPRKSENFGQLSKETFLPFWGLSMGPRGEAGWRLENDQHMEIFYAQVVKGVPRSDPKSKRPLRDDDNKPDDPKQAKYPKDLDGLGSEWHIIARDETLYAPLQIGDFVEYWHRGEFQIRDPNTKNVLPQRKQVYLRVRGLFPNWEYSCTRDDTINIMPPSWETYSTSSKDGFKTRYYHSRRMRLPNKLDGND